MHIQDALATFVVQLRANGRSEHTVRQYSRHVRALDRFLQETGYGTDVGTITPAVLAKFLTSPTAVDRAGGGRKRATTVNALRTSLRCYFAHLTAAGVIATNPARLLRRARCTPPPPRPITEDDLRRLLDTTARDQSVSGRRDHAMLVLLSETGVRLGSAVALDVDDIDLGTGEATLRVTKAGGGQQVLLTKSACEALKAHLGDRSSGPVFAARSGRRLSTRHVQRRFAAWLARAGVERRPTVHMIRHRYASRLYAKTGDVLLVRQALGHKSIGSTLVYVDSDRSRLRAAVE